MLSIQFCHFVEGNIIFQAPSVFHLIAWYSPVPLGKYYEIKARSSLRSFEKQNWKFHSGSFCLTLLSSMQDTARQTCLASHPSILIHGHNRSRWKLVFFFEFRVLSFLIEFWVFHEFEVFQWKFLSIFKNSKYFW